jgi:hypothetical protein
MFTRLEEIYPKPYQLKVEYTQLSNAKYYSFRYMEKKNEPNAITFFS